MYAMTAAHAILAIPSYARVTNLRTGSAVVVRINDRGPFVEGRIIDVSYTAAHKLGILAGATMVEVESIIPAGSGSSIVAQQQPPVAEKAPVETSPVATPARPEPIGAIAVPAVAAPPPAAAAPPPAVGAPAASAPSAPAVATTTPATAAPTTQTPITTEGGRVFVQLGAFASRENADALLARLKSQVDWLALQIVSRDGLHHVQAGPYANQSDARQAAERVVQALGIKPMVQVR
jgi:rare lipoprotein A